MNDKQVSKLENTNRELKVATYFLGIHLSSVAVSKLENPNRELKDTVSPVSFTHVFGSFKTRKSQ